MRPYYLDTSAILKRYRTEKGTAFVDELYRLRPGESLLTSHFTCLEFEAVAARALKGQVLDDQKYHTLLASFGRDLDEYLLLLPVHTPLMTESIAFASRYALRAPDSIHLASASRLQRSAADVVLVASDRALLAAASSLMQTLNPEDDGATEILSRMRQ